MLPEETPVPSKCQEWKVTWVVTTDGIHKDKYWVLIGKIQTVHVSQWNVMSLTVPRMSSFSCCTAALPKSWAKGGTSCPSSELLASFRSYCKSFLCSENGFSLLKEERGQGQGKELSVSKNKQNTGITPFLWGKQERRGRFNTIFLVLLFASSGLGTMHYKIASKHGKWTCVLLKTKENHT